jgi:alkylation response protein AidB-like acyl-CoA dehydrogenase
MSVSEIDPTLVPGRLDSIDVPNLAAGFGFTEEHELARQAARRLLGERSPIATVRKLVDDPLGFDAELYREMAGLGWLGLTVGEAYGGSAAGHLHLALLLEEMGRVLLPSPFFGSLVAIETLMLAGEASYHRLAPIVSGEKLASVAFTDPMTELSVRAEAGVAGFALTGTVSHVPFGANADLLLVPARERTGTIILFAIELPLEGVLVEPEVSVDTTRRTARVTFDRARVTSASKVDGDGALLLSNAQIAGAALLAAEMVGVAEGILVRTRDYAAERQQFGKSIGAFQAVKHPIVDLMMGVELSRSMSLGASVLLDSGVAHAEVTARMAKAHVSEVLAFGVKKGVQLHGGFGFTWDADVHFYFKRSLWSRATFGDAIHHRQLLATRLLGAS